ncbi:MAG: dephospho-CoA kinase [Rhodospirillales bacterium]|nr:dephospho-CoA kinase [Rhodospirillales bacterium]
MIILGLTGSIGMGKSVAAKHFRRLGIPIHDADRAVHNILAHDKEAIRAVEKLFPKAVKKGAVDREAVAKLVFGDPEALLLIEELLHPLVRARERTFLECAARRVCKLVILDVPLLFETGGETRCDGVITVSAPAFLQRQRVLRRPGMTKERLASILARQTPDVEKRRRSDFVVLTGLGRDFGLRQIQNIVRITGEWAGAKWPPKPVIRGT